MTPPTDTPDSLRAAFAEIRARQDAGELPRGVTPSARADWAYGNAVIENDAVTREMATAAVERRGRL